MKKIILEKFRTIYRVSIHLQRSHEALAIVQTTVGKEISVFTRRRVTGVLPRATIHGEQCTAAPSDLRDLDTPLDTLTVHWYL
jgi:hypothetical protein